MLDAYCAYLETCFRAARLHAAQSGELVRIFILSMQVESRSPRRATSASIVASIGPPNYPEVREPHHRSTARPARAAGRLALEWCGVR